MMLGQMRLEGSMYRSAEPSLVGEISQANLARAVALLPAAVFVAREAQVGRHPDRAIEATAALGAVKDGAFAERDGMIVEDTMQGPA